VREKMGTERRKTVKERGKGKSNGYISLSSFLPLSLSVSPLLFYPRC
jgi:hypothetical protein